MDAVPLGLHPSHRTGPAKGETATMQDSAGRARSCLVESKYCTLCFRRCTIDGQLTVYGAEACAQGTLL